MRINSIFIAAAFLAAAAISTLATCAFAAEAPKPYGLWEGTVGKQKVMVVLATKDCTSAYYYLRHAQSIHLEARDQVGLTLQEYVEGKTTGNWSLQQNGADMLQGSWSSVDGKRSLPISLKRLETKEAKEDECSFLFYAYYDSLLETALDSLVVKDAKMGELSYRNLIVPGTDVSTFEIPPGKYHVPRLNKALRADLPEHVSRFYDCTSGRLRVHNVYDVTISPNAVQGNVLNYDTEILDNCGAYPVTSSSQSSWDLVHDRPIEPVNVDYWLRHDKSGNWRSTKLIDLIDQAAADYTSGEACDSEGVAGISVALGKDEDGLAFYFAYPHVLQSACDHTVEVPFDKLAPFLSPEGKKAVAELRRKKQR